MTLITNFRVHHKTFKELLLNYHSFVSESFKRNLMKTVDDVYKINNFVEVLKNLKRMLLMNQYLLQMIAHSGCQNI